VHDPLAIAADRRAGVVASVVANGLFKVERGNPFTSEDFFPTAEGARAKRAGMLHDWRQMKAACEAEKGGDLTVPGQVA